MTTTELSADTRGQILDAAWHRVHEHGASAISVKDIAGDAGVSRQLVYFHYGNRAGLALPPPAPLLPLRQPRRPLYGAGPPRRRAERLPPRRREVARRRADRG